MSLKDAAPIPLLNAEVCDMINKNRLEIQELRMDLCKGHPLAQRKLLDPEVLRSEIQVLQYLGEDGKVLVHKDETGWDTTGGGLPRFQSTYTDLESLEVTQATGSSQQNATVTSTGKGSSPNRLLAAPEILQLMNLRAKRACDVYTVVPDLEQRCGGADAEGAVTEEILKAIRPLCPTKM